MVRGIGSIARLERAFAASPRKSILDSKVRLT